MKKYIFLIILWVIAIGLGISYFKLPPKDKVNIITKKIESKEEDLQEAKIYVPEVETGKLKPKNIKVSVELTIDEKILNVLNYQIKELYLKKLLTKDKLKVLNIYFIKDKIYVDFSRQIEELEANNANSKLAIFSIVNSLTEFSEFKEVQLLINGKIGSKSLKQSYERQSEYIM